MSNIYTITINERAIKWFNPAKGTSPVDMQSYVGCSLSQSDKKRDKGI